MREVINIRPNSEVITSYNEYHSFMTSAIPTDTDRYVVLGTAETNNIRIENVGKYSIFDIADWFLCKEEMTQKKLQKLCYYAQAWCYALKEYRLEDTDYQAWVHGPVSPALWEKFKSFGYNAIRRTGKYSAFIEEEDVELLENVWDTYGENTGNALEALTHRELPWTEARRGYNPEERCTVVISPDTMKSYYKSIYCGD